MAMHINLSSEMESFIKGKVADGFYGNATEVIRDAIRRMQAEEGRLAAWRAALKRGDDELDRGESLPYTAAALEEIAQNAKAVRNNTAAMDADALP